MRFCRDCGIKIKYPYKYCDYCNDIRAGARGQLDRAGRLTVAAAKRRADASGNLKIWTNNECTQEFLMSLVRQCRG
jgi:hypothetical protein